VETSNLQKRVISGTLGGGLLFFLVWMGGLWLWTAMIVLALQMLREWRSLVPNGAYMLAGGLYIAAVMGSLGWLDEQGATVYKLFLYIWAVDTCAYFVGRALKGPKLLPSVSPGKTWSGLMGGVAGCALVLWAFGEDVWWAAPVTVIAQVSDLMISYFKRKVGVKDTGKVLPGHGGLLDRFDGFLLSIPFIAGVWWVTGGLL